MLVSLSSCDDSLGVIVGDLQEIESAKSTQQKVA